MTVRGEVQRQRRMRVSLDSRALRSPAWAQLGLRFAFGAGIALAAGLIGMRFGPRTGGVFLAFPAILPAALTLLERSDGVEKTDVDALGAVLGAVALAAFAVAAALLAARLAPALAVVGAAVAWTTVALALYQVARRLRRPRRG